MKVYIYCLLDENKIPFYIGKTRNDLRQRESQHKRRLNRNVKILELDYVEENDWKYWEEHYIQLYKSQGINLINLNKGGGGPSYHTKESKLKMKGAKHPGTSQKLKGIRRPDVSERFKGGKLSQETKDKISQNKKGHECYQNLERGKKIKESNLNNYKPNSERNKKISDKLIGRKADWMKYLSKPIFQYDKQGNFIREWGSASEAGSYINKVSSAISECCTGKRKTIYGFIWKFKEHSAK